MFNILAEAEPMPQCKYACVLVLVLVYERILPQAESMPHYK